LHIGFAGVFPVNAINKRKLMIVPPEGSRNVFVSVNTGSEPTLKGRWTMSPNFNRPVRPATIFVTFVLAITFLLSSTFVLAQTTVATGSIQGNVTDPSGAVVSGAKVTITDKSRGSVINTTTNSSGSYASGALVPGEYVVRVEAPGFKATQ